MTWQELVYKAVERTCEAYEYHVHATTVTYPLICTACTVIGIIVFGVVLLEAAVLAHKYKWFD